MTTYLVIKQENRPDGITNKATESRQTFSSAMSLFYSWASTASATELFTSVVLTILDNNANIIENKIITNQAVTDTKLEALTEEVRKHNDFASRIPVLENRVDVLEVAVKELKDEAK